MHLYVDRHIVYTPRPMFVNKKLMITIDSSKTNSGIAVADMNGNVLNVIEMNGSDAGTAEVDTLYLCLEERRVLKTIFEGSKPTIVGIENIITKKKDGMESHLDIHETRFKITAVFMSFISFFQDTYGITPELINNWAWKSDILPADLRTEKVYKGSQEYLKRIKSKWANCSDDVTDAICMLEFLCKKHHIIRGIQIDGTELSRYEFQYYITSTEYWKKYKNKFFIPNNSLTRLQNNIVVSNNIEVTEFGVYNVPIEEVELEELYTRASGKFEKQVSEVSILIKRAA